VHFAQLFRDAIETHDVSMISLAAIALRDTSMPFADAPGKPVQFASIDFMRKALGTLQLPRDIEAFGELLHTISFYEGKAYEGSLKPDYNNAPNWAFADKLKPDQQIEIVTEKGQVIVELWPDVAPLTVAYMLKNIERGFYSNKRIHRLVPGFVIQDGCPRGDGYGGASETIRSEFSDRSFETGVLGMASAGPDTESTQWFIMQSDAPHLNGRYTAFGKVVSGLEHVLNMKHGGRIISMRVLP
jgi:cyclophilin family peptidyl-prolyl cis-trans isomerase